MKKKKLKKNIRRGRRNRQRGFELQRHAVRLAKDIGLGAQHELGDIEIEDKFYGCKRRKVIPKWLLPEKSEVGVVFRGERLPAMIAVPLDTYYLLLKLARDMNNE